jgi:hypothetical protein
VSPLTQTCKSRCQHVHASPSPDANLSISVYTYLETVSLATPHLIEENAGCLVPEVLSHESPVHWCGLPTATVGPGSF